MTETEKTLKKDFNFIASFVKSNLHQNFSNRIFWNKNRLYATNGSIFIWKETEENPAGFSAWQIENKSCTEIKDKEQLQYLFICNFDNRLLRHYYNFNTVFNFSWDMEVPFPFKLCSDKKKKKDFCTFDTESKELVITFEDDEVKAFYGDFMTDIDGKQNITIPFWIMKLILKKTKTFKAYIGIAQEGNGFIKISFGKWNILTVQRTGK